MFNGFYKYLTPEDHVQQQVLCHILDKYPKMKYAHVPNEGKRTAFERFKAKYLGISPGFLDLILVGYGHILFLEVKSNTGQLRKKQREWIAHLQANDFAAAVGFGAEQCIEIIDEEFKHRLNTAL